MYEVIVGDVGTRFYGKSRLKALRAFRHYARLGLEVVLFGRSGLPVREYHPGDVALKVS